MPNQKEDEKKGSGSEVRIKVCKDGPYLVTGRIPITKQTISCDEKGTPRQWIEGEKYPLHETWSLCRCGQSEHKPFCDGTHVKVKFDGTESASRQPYIEQAKKIDGSTLELDDAEILCASARFCHRGGEIWSLVARTEEPKTKKIVIEDAGDCPSGRLVVRDKKTGKTVEPDLEKSIGLVEDPNIGVSGPIWVRGGVPVESADGKEYEIRNRVTLCRCGKSANKPFCDSSHYPEDFQEVKSDEQG
jgi:CDGSH-type Zn-finger protein